MISLKENQITLGDKSEPILRFEVWFQSPFGLLTDRVGAIEQVAAHDLEPDQVLIPVSVAVSETLYEVVGR